MSWFCSLACIQNYDCFTRRSGLSSCKLVSHFDRWSGCHITHKWSFLFIFGFLYGSSKQQRSIVQLCTNFNAWWTVSSQPAQKKTWYCKWRLDVATQGNRGWPESCNGRGGQVFVIEINLDNVDDYDEDNVEKVEKFTMCVVCERHAHNVVSMVRKSFPLAGLQFQTGGAEDLPQANNSAQVHRYHRHRYLGTIGTGT